MPITRLDEVRCQTLKVSGEYKIEKAIDVTTKIISTQAGDVVLSKAAGTEDICNVTVTVEDVDGNTLTGIKNFLCWLSDDSTGVSEASTMVLDSFAPTTGSTLLSLTANATILCQSDATGKIVLALTDDVVGASSVGYVCVQHPLSGLVYTIQIETGDYGVA